MLKYSGSNILLWGECGCDGGPSTVRTAPGRAPRGKADGQGIDQRKHILNDSHKSFCLFAYANWGVLNEYSLLNSETVGIC